jgi:hypothetical protein
MKETQNLELPLDSSSKTVSVRFERADYLTLLETAKADNLSIGALVKKRALSASLTPNALIGFDERLEGIESHVAALRCDFILAVEALLFGAGKFSPEEAQEWVKKKISPNL